MNNQIIIKDKILYIKTNNEELKTLEFNYVGTIKPKYKEEIYIDNNHTMYDIFVEKLKHNPPKKLVGYLQKQIDNHIINYNWILEPKHFCEFKLDNVKNEMGIYLWVVNNEIKYVGITKYLYDRFKEYGHINEYNISKNGRSTNCKMNLKAGKWKNQKIDIYFYSTESYDDKFSRRTTNSKRRMIEKYLIEYLTTTCNIKLENSNN